MGKPWLVVTAAAVVATTGCEARVRECGGGVEVVIALADVDALTVAAGTLRVTPATHPRQVNEVGAPPLGDLGLDDFTPR